MRRGWWLAVALWVALAPGVVGAAEPLRDGQEISLWPGTAPGSEGVRAKRVVVQRSGDPALSDRYVQGVTAPKLTAFVPSRPNGASAIVVPGGGYLREVLDKECGEVARWLVVRGVTAFVLEHRLPGEGHRPRWAVALQDAQRAVRTLRSRAADWGLDPARIGVIGFSAGGHVASTLSTQFDRATHAPVDALDALSARPDFAVLLYPVITMEAGVAHEGSRRRLLGDSPDEALVRQMSSERQVTRSTPPTLLVATDDDPFVPAENSLRYYRALRRAGVSAELHVYATGGHGFGIRGAAGKPVGGWPSVMGDWLRARGVIPAP